MGGSGGGGMHVEKLTAVKMSEVIAQSPSGEAIYKNPLSF